MVGSQLESRPFYLYMIFPHNLQTYTAVFSRMINLLLTKFARERSGRELARGLVKTSGRCSPNARPLRLVNKMCKLLFATTLIN